MKQIISEISKSVVPKKTVEKSKNDIAKIAYDLVENEIKKYSEVLGLEFGGSFAKGTWLSKDADVDIFVKFKKSTSEEKFEKKTHDDNTTEEKVGKESLLMTVVLHAATALSTIIMASFVDPIIGEFNKRYGNVYGLFAGLISSIAIYQLIIGVFFYALIGGVVAVLIERPKFKWFDDDLLIQIFPILVMTIFYLSGLGPDLQTSMEAMK